MIRKASFVALIVGLIIVTMLPSLPGATSQPAGAQEDNLNFVQSCAATENQLLGQDWEVTGGSGGITTDPNKWSAYGEFDESTLTPEAQNTLANIFQNEPVSLSKTTVLLIIDDFGTFVAGETHGYYVYEVAGRLLQELGVLYNIEDVGGIPGQALKPGITGQVILDQVDTSPDCTSGACANYDVEYMVNMLHAKLEEYVDLGYTDFVLNMSFVLMPCTSQIGEIPLPYPDFLAQYIGREGQYSIVDYLEEAGVKLDREEIRQELAKVLASYAQDTLECDVSQASGASTLDPLHCYLQGKHPNYQLPANITVVPVAAAGNMNSDENARIPPFAPGVWADVISVSATTAISNFQDLAIWSNDGEVKAPGAWWYLEDLGKHIAGTSFAAPAMSAVVALMQGIGVPGYSCDFTDLQNGVPAQNYYYLTALWNPNPPPPPTPACHP